MLPILSGVAIGITAVLQLTRALLEATLNRRPVIDLGPLQLRLVYNRGIAFGIAEGLSDWVVPTVTATLCITLASFLLWKGRHWSISGLAAGAAILAGAISNLIDRILIGSVADYFHTGWFPTFNGADVAITFGAATLLILSLLGRLEVRDRSRRA